jgi:hypothetical protein
MEAKKAALYLSIMLGLGGVVDFVSRLTVGDLSVGKTTTTDAKVAAVSQAGGVMLDEAAIGELLSWSDSKPTVAEPDKALPVAAVAPPVVVEAPKPPDIHNIVRQAIAGDTSKRLIGDDLLTLRGIFYDGKDFASVEIENITTKVKQYVTFAVNKAGADFKLVEIGKYHVVLKKADQSIKLELFK